MNWRRGRWPCDAQDPQAAVPGPCVSGALDGAALTQAHRQNRSSRVPFSANDRFLSAAVADAAVARSSA